MGMDLVSSRHVQSETHLVSSHAAELVTLTH